MLPQDQLDASCITRSSQLRNVAEGHRVMLLFLLAALSRLAVAKTDGSFLTESSAERVFPRASDLV